MSHISSIGAAIYTDLAVSTGAVASGKAAAYTLPTSFAAATLQAFFATENTDGAGTAGSSFNRIVNVREFPSIGTPPNIVNIANYQQKQSSTIQGQADAPSLEVTLNYVPALWTKGVAGTLTSDVLGNMVGDGIARVWRFTIMQADSTGSGATKYASTAGGVGTVQNSQYYWIGKLEALAVKPDLKDSLTATLTLSIQSDFYGAFTI